MADLSFQPDWFSKPGDTLLTLMEHRDLTSDVLAQKLGRSVTIISGLLSGSVEIDGELADGLAKHVGGTASFWLTRQSKYAGALNRAASAVSNEAGDKWLKQFPHSDISNYGWVSPKRREDRLKTYLAYFGVSDPQEWIERYANPLGVSFRTSPSFASKAGALSAWLRRGELEAAAVPTSKWNPQKLRQHLLEMRALTRANAPAHFLPRIRRICADAGVALVFVRAPSGCRASGATRFLSPNKAMVIQSFRHLSDDHFWFTFFHELGHLLLHGTSATFIDGGIENVTKQESEANEFSASVLIPPEQKDELLDLKPKTEQVIKFAFSLGVSPGVVVGQLQHNRIIKPSQLNFLKRRFTWDQISAALSNP
ncbi:ImmA/IrrE family metallo-endopeptidase [Bradyrhizobium sp. C-145]|uniref:ImmA/IrrE family metallo-endopeptidase n=1 Tax=Bradyrhizobium sp. C-145 TaxID=574727 RepID=UPI00201B6F99|nr:ImmA/IrrE family metallo-endopeptidase [Bradyrhizobium sp. C-145]UQR63395.1 ImmA/IrrE family metallo-endopeptidase [Bradyrhizobium sp. C-145]